MCFLFVFLFLLWAALSSKWPVCCIGLWASIAPLEDCCSSESPQPPSLSSSTIFSGSPLSWSALSWPTLCQLMFLLISVGWLGSFYLAWVWFDIHSHLLTVTVTVMSEILRPISSRHQRMLRTVFLSVRIIPLQSHPKLSCEKEYPWDCAGRCFSIPSPHSHLSVDKAGS